MKPMSMKSRQDLIGKLERDLSKTCQRVYELSANGKLLTPLKPYIIVRVLPKEHVTAGGIILPETSQNKPVYEGIVLATWKPYTDYVSEKCPCGCGYNMEREIHRESSVSVGERIAFPHFEGLPVGDWLDDKRYRLVREWEISSNGMPHCNILGKLSYEGDILVQAEIRKLTSKLGSITTSGVSVSRGADPSQKYM